VGVAGVATSGGLAVTIKRASHTLFLLALAATGVLLVRPRRPTEAGPNANVRRRRPWRWLAAASVVVVLLGSAAVLFSAYTPAPAPQVASALPTSDAVVLGPLEVEVDHLLSLLPPEP